MHAARRRRVLWTYRPSGRWDVRMGAVAGAAYLPHSLTPHDQRCAAVAANANTRPPLTDAAVRSWCDAVPGPSTAGLCTRGCAHRCARPGPVHRLGYRVAVALGRLAERPSTVRRGLGSPLPHLRRDWADSPSGRRVCAPARARARWRRTRLRARRRWERALDLLTAHNMHSITGRVLHHNLSRSLQH
jgi:hypothetical protein